ncbi:MAG: hypothetical protein KJZ87_25160, partial [Thermoguttaceae bacterium]|nr:hypothetical protein [Thermoguttaceae bacterium]
MRRSALFGLALALAFTIAASAGEAKRPAGRGQQADLLAIPQVSKDQIICFALYTVHNNTLKLTAQLYPLDDTDPRTVRLEVNRGGHWEQVATTEVVTPGWTAPFRVENWDMSQEVPYRVRHGESAVYEGLIRRDPLEK